MFIEEYKNKHDDICKTDKFRKSVSEGLKKYIEENGFSDGHRQKLKAAQLKAYREKVKNATGEDIESIEGKMCVNPCTGKIGGFDTRSLKCYCVLKSGEIKQFKSIKDAGLWWYENYHPFGESYSQATF